MLLLYEEKLNIILSALYPNGNPKKQSIVRDPCHI